MTDVQLLTAAMAVVIPLSMLIYSNSRITEAKETLRAEIRALGAEMNAGFARMSLEIQAIRTEVKIHELEKHE